MAARRFTSLSTSAARGRLPGLHHPELTGDIADHRDAHDDLVRQRDQRTTLHREVGVVGEGEHERVGGVRSATVVADEQNRLVRDVLQPVHLGPEVKLDTQPEPRQHLADELGITTLEPCRRPRQRLAQSVQWSRHVGFHPSAAASFRLP